MHIQTDAARVHVIDSCPQANIFQEEVLSGLRAESKSLPCKYFYDARGSQLFDRICELDAYYLTRTELAVMEAHVEEMVRRLGPRCLLVEYGSGSSVKTRLLLDEMVDPAAYVPIDISGEHLAESAARLRERYPHLDILPVCADYTQRFELPEPMRRPLRAAIYFPGSTIGNFHPAEAVAFMKEMAAVCGSGGALLIGVDLQKDTSVLEAAYNDPEGITAAFNKNLLRRMNRDLEARFDLDAFRHEALYNEEEGRIEMYLVSLRDQCVQIGKDTITFGAGERVSTEYSYKYTLRGFAERAAGAGFRVAQVWTDPSQLFSVQYLVAE